MAGSRTVASGRDPWSRSSSSQASTAPGTAAARGPEPGTWSRPMAANASGVAAAGAGPCPHSTRGVGSAAVATRAGRSPPGPFRCGSTTCRTNPPATAASKALPPSSSIRCADCDASQWVDETIPKVPFRVGRVVNVIGRGPRPAPRSWRGAEAWAHAPTLDAPLRGEHDGTGSGYRLPVATGSDRDNRHSFPVCGGHHHAQHDAGLPAHHRRADEARHRRCMPTPRWSPRPPTAPAARPTPSSAGGRPGWPTACARWASTGDQRVGTFQWNNAEHLEAYLAVPSMGAVLHTLNIRLFPEQLVYIANHAEDQVVIVDDSLVGLLAPAPAGDEDRAARAGRRPGRRERRPRLAALQRQGGARSTRTCSPPARGVRLARGGRAVRRRDVLHQRHHRPPEGRRLQPPLDLAALAGGVHRQRRRRSASTTGCCRSCRCSTPTRGASPTPR